MLFLDTATKRSENTSNDHNRALADRKGRAMLKNHEAVQTILMTEAPADVPRMVKAAILMGLDAQDNQDRPWDKGGDDQEEPAMSLTLGQIVDIQALLADNEMIIILNADQIPEDAKTERNLLSLPDAAFCAVLRSRHKMVVRHGDVLSRQLHVSYASTTTLKKRLMQILQDRSSSSDQTQSRC